MAEFRVCVEETLSRIVEVEAADEREAIRKVEEMYRNEEIVLDAGDLSGDAEIEIWE